MQNDFHGIHPVNFCSSVKKDVQFLEGDTCGILHVGEADEVLVEEF